MKTLYRPRDEGKLSFLRCAPQKFARRLHLPVKICRDGVGSARNKSANAIPSAVACTCVNIWRSADRGRRIKWTGEKRSFIVSCAPRNKAHRERRRRDKKRERERENGKLDTPYFTVYSRKRIEDTDIHCGRARTGTENWYTGGRGRAEKWIWACNICDPLREPRVARVSRISFMI